MTQLNEVIAYINEARALGMSDEQVSAALRDIGWQAGHIQQAFLRAGSMPWSHTHGAPVSTEPRAIIEVRNLTKRYGSLVAVDDISFHVNRGETFGILGPNGAGKTTTLEMIEGLKQISGGSILVDGKDVATQAQEVKAIIGVQLQASSFFESMNLRELIDLFAGFYGRTVDAMELLAEVQLTDKANSEVKDLSGGQKQRFSIAIGLVNNPKVLFLDEPTTGLDPQARRNLWDLVGQIKRKGTTVVLTTHYMDEAEILCDRIAVMDHAKVVALDTTRNLLHSLGVSSTIEFRSKDDIAEGTLKSLEAIQSLRHENGVHYLSTTNPQRTLDALFSASRVHRFGVEELTLKRVTLEDVFLKLTGHQLRD